MTPPAQPPPPGRLHVQSDGWPGDSVEDPALDTATKTLREREPPSTQRLIARVMTNIVRDQVWPGSTLPLGDPTRALWIAERAASAVLRRAADQPRERPAVSGGNHDRILWKHEKPSRYYVNSPRGR